MKTIVTCMAIAMTVLVCSCNNQNKIKDPEPDAESVALQAPSSAGQMADTISLSTNALVNKDTKKSKGDKKQPEPFINWDKKIIKTAHLTFELKDYKRYNTELHKSLKGFSGYIAGEEQVENDDRITNTLIIKVPVEQFEEVVNNLPTEGVKVISKQIESDDVTSQVVDTKSRIEAKKQVRLRYLELLKQARNMADILQVQSEINNIQEALELATGRVNALEHQSAYSTINLTYYQLIDNGGTTSLKPTYYHRLAEAFHDGAYFISQLIIVLVTFWPLLLLVIISLVFIKRSKGKTIKVTS